MEKSLSYLEIKELDKIWKFSLSNLYINTSTAYYYCTDTNCTVKCTYNFYHNNDKSEYEILKENNSKIILTKEHNIPFEEHEYNINKRVIEDINNKPLNEIKEKLKNYKYRLSLLKYIAINNDEIGLL